MGFLSILGKVAGIAAAPFTGGATLIPSLIGLGTDIAGGIINNKASNKATNSQLSSITEAERRGGMGVNDLTGTLREGQQESYDAQLGALERITAGNRPYTDVGGRAMYSLGDMLDSGQFKNPDIPDPMIDPGFKFRMDEAMKALSRSAAGRSRLLSGGTLKELQDYAQGLASQEYGNAFNRSLQTAQYGREGVQDLYNRVYGIAEMGSQAAGRQQGAEQNFGNQAQNLNMDVASQIANAQFNNSREFQNLATDAGNVRASGYVQRANNLGRTVRNVGDQIGSMISLRSARRGGGGGWESRMPEADNG